MLQGLLGHGRRLLPLHRVGPCECPAGGSGASTAPSSRPPGPSTVTVAIDPSFSPSALGSGLPANIQLDIDGDRETERIYTLFSSYMRKLEQMQGEGGRPRRARALLQG